MRVATQPVKIDGIEFDALIDKKITYSSDVPEYPIETGVTVSDTIINKSIELAITVCVSNTPVTWYQEHGTSETRVEEVLNDLEILWKTRKLVTVETSFDVFENMVITSMGFEKTLEQSYSRDIPITLRQVTITETETAEVPSNYEKVGETKASAGSANTKSSGRVSGVGGSSDTPDYLKDVRDTVAQLYGGRGKSQAKVYKDLVFGG